MREYLRLTLAVANLKPFWQAKQQPGYHHTQQQLLYNSQAVYKLTRALLLGSSSIPALEVDQNFCPCLKGKGGFLIFWHISYFLKFYPREPRYKSILSICKISY